VRYYIRVLLIAGFVSALVFPSYEAYALTDKPWLMALYANYGRFDANKANSDGAQSIGYFQLVYDKSKWGAGITSSYNSVSYQAGRATDSYDLSGFTDTALTTFYNKRIKKANLRFGVDIGLPTGKNAVTVQNLSRVIVDDVREDLLLLNTYGAGFNVAPNFAATYNTGSVTWGLGGRYLFAGEYDPTTDFAGDSFDPGDSLSVVASALTSISASDSLFLTLIYTTYGKDKQGGRDVFRNGDIYTFEARYVKRFIEDLTSTLAFVFKKQDKNERLQEGAVLKSETGNSNANVLEFLFENIYRYSRRFSLTAVTGYKTVGSNDYGEDDSFQDAGRDKIYIEPGAIWKFGESAYSTFKLRYSRLNDKKDAFSPEDTTYNVLNLDIGVVLSF